MNKTIAGMLEFVNSGRTDIAEIEGVIAEVGQLQFRVIAINILSWLKWQKRTGKARPLELNEQYDWCCNLLRLVKAKVFLADLVHANDTSLLLIRALDEEELKNLIAFVDAEYRPRLRADPRRQISDHRGRE